VICQAGRRTTLSKLIDKCRMMHHVVLAPSKSIAVEATAACLCAEDHCLDDPIGIFGTAARFSCVLDGLPVWNLNALRIEANWHALGRWNDAPDFGGGAARGWLGGLV
jgi:hypothetical protein